MESQSEQLQVTAEFDLPLGYEEDGVFHKHVIMRRVKSVDIKSLKLDTEIKALRSEPFDTGSNNPATAMVSLSAMTTVYAILFQKVVLSLGSIPKEKITRTVFENMYQMDMMFLIAKYNEMNGIEVNEFIKEAMGREGRTVPFDQ